MSKITNDELLQVRLARMEGWKHLAKQLPDHHVLSVELVRTPQDETAAVFTVVRNQRLVQYLVRADARGRVKPSTSTSTGQGCDDPRDRGGHGHGHGHGHGDHGHASQGVEVHALAATAAPAAAGDGPVDPNIIALGQPPEKEPPPPGIAALAGVLLSSAFDVGEQLPSGNTTPT